MYLFLTHIFLEFFNTIILKAERERTKYDSKTRHRNRLFARVDTSRSPQSSQPPKPVPVPHDRSPPVTCSTVTKSNTVPNTVPNSVPPPTQISSPQKCDERVTQCDERVAAQCDERVTAAPCGDERMKSDENVGSPQEQPRIPPNGVVVTNFGPNLYLNNREPQHKAHRVEFIANLPRVFRQTYD